MHLFPETPLLVGQENVGHKRRRRRTRRRRRWRRDSLLRPRPSFSFLVLPSHFLLLLPLLSMFLSLLPPPRFM